MGSIKKETLISMIILMIAFGSCKNDSNRNWNYIPMLSRNNSNVELELNQFEYVKWILNPENGLKKEKVIGEFNYKLQYRPIELQACIEAGMENIKINELNDRINTNDLIQFTFSMGAEKGTGELLKYDLVSYEQYDQRIKYLAFDASDDFKIIQNEDTIHCGLFHFERAFDIAPFITFSLGFEKSYIDLHEELTFIFDDKVFNKGMVKFTFPAGKLEGLPKLKIMNS